MPSLLRIPRDFVAPLIETTSFSSDREIGSFLKDLTVEDSFYSGIAFSLPSLASRQTSVGLNAYVLIPECLYKEMYH